MQKYSFIQWYKNTQNLGSNKHFETACQRSTGEFIAISDQNDVWFSTKIEKLIQHIGYHYIYFVVHYRVSSLDKSHITYSLHSLESLLLVVLQGT